MTNADRIRSMSDEELAHFCELMRYDENNKIPYCKNLKECDEILGNGDDIPEFLCERCLLEWLRKEVDYSG